MAALDSGMILAMKRFLFVLIIGFTFYSQVHAEAPECDREEIEQYWNDAIPRVYEAIESHLEESRLLASDYDGYPDLACFTELHLSIGVETKADSRRRVEQLLELDGGLTYKNLVRNMGDPGSFLYERYYERALCVLQQLAHRTVDYSSCEDPLELAVRFIKELQPGTSSNVTSYNEDKGTKTSSEDVSWCLLSSGVFLHIESVCLDRDGEIFQSKVLAEAEYQRLESENVNDSTKTVKQEDSTAVIKESKVVQQDPPDYRPLVKRGTGEDEAFCREAFFDDSRWNGGDPNKQVALDHCWDFTDIDGKYFYGLQGSLKKKTKLIGQVNGWLLFLTKKGMYAVARALRVGRGSRIKLDKSIEYYQTTARTGHAKAQYFMGLFYVEGHGVQQDYDEAEKWLRKSVENGDADAKTYLGYLLEFGIGLDKDLVESRQLYREAASAGHPWAKKRLSK